MAHLEQKQFCLYVKQKFPSFFRNKRVLDVGSGDVNGNNRFLFEDCHYCGVDVVSAPNVDVVSKCHDLDFDDGHFDVIISTECFEHDMYLELSLKSIVRMLKSGGLFVFSCATTGRPEHGTSRVQGEASFHMQVGDERWSNFYKNLTKEDIEALIDVGQIFPRHRFIIGYDQCDLYFYGEKRSI
jgi:SAM-dependent methyltransferase